MRKWIAGTVVAAALAFTPASLTAQTKPANATAECSDGTYSTAKTKRGACSGHGGIKTWLAADEAGSAKAEAKAAGKSTKTAAKATGRAAQSVANSVKPRPADAPQDATAKCTDGSYSHAQQHRGACSGHGGVAEWYK